MSIHKIKFNLCSSHHLASNDLVERFHSIFLAQRNLLNSRPEFKNGSIKIKIPLAIVAYNGSIHSATRITSFKILNYDMHKLLHINLGKQIVNIYIQSHKENSKHCIN